MEENELLYYYQQELLFIRQLGEKFAESHPKIAGNLRLSSKNVEDPHVARLMEAFALNNARICHKLAEDSSEIPEAVLNILQPHLLAPVPSMSIVQFHCNEQKLIADRILPAGTPLISEPTQGGPCYFKTCYPVQLFPFKIVQASLTGKPFAAPAIPAFKEAVSVFRLSMACLQANQTFSNFNFDSIRFFINAPFFQANIFYELLFNNLIGIALGNSVNDPQPIVFSKQSVQRVGFKEEEGLIPYDRRVFMGYRLLTEFFTFPEKFLFFDIMLSNFANKFTKPAENLELFFYFNRLPAGLEKQLSADFLQLGCTPIINLFEKKAEPIPLTMTKTEYLIIPDASVIPESLEIFSVNKVLAYSETGRKSEYLPFFKNGSDPNRSYYYLHRKPAWQAQYYPLSGSECFLSFTDTQEPKSATEKWVIEVELTCTNRDLPTKLPCGEGKPFFKIVNLKQDIIKQISCLSSITPSYRPNMRKENKWRYVSNLQLSFLSLMDQVSGIEVLKELLRTYHFQENDNLEILLEGLLAISYKQITTRHTVNRVLSFSRGLEITLMVDENKFSDYGLFLFSSILDCFFSLYVTINSFTQLVIVNRHSELYRFPSRAGEQFLI
ncbi:MAG: type VI secretion system baseplate subunit TssF [Proteobacteria bacterium]|nr:type VI secretion system baseplate subunit TssF [Pseudomonadota bacterium]